MRKRDIINFLFILSFPVYGIGNFISASISPSAGYLFSISTYIVMIVFYFVDLMYKDEFRIRLNLNYGLMTLFLFSCVLSLFVALNKGLPETTQTLTITRSLLVIIPFQALIVFILYNQENEDAIASLTLKSLSLLLFINLVGYFGLGMKNQVHGIDGRLNFPFLDGLYSGSSLLAIINLMLMYYIFRATNNPIKLTGLLIYFTINLILFFFINSRIAILIFLFVFMLFCFGLMRIRGLYAVSLFTLPILLSSGLLLYKIFQLPALAMLMQRVDVEDVKTFNGRAFLWEDAIDWLFNDQRGLIWGNGYKGHYFLDMISDVAKLWNEKNLHVMHLHSSSLEILVSQGIIFFLIFCILFYKIYVFYRKKITEGKEEGAFMAAILFLIFVMQVDTFVYLDSLGFIFFSLFVARISITFRPNPKRGILLSQKSLRKYAQIVSATEMGTEIKENLN